MKIKKLKCLRCDHKWFPRKEKKPRTCPKCNSAYWDTPRRKKNKKTSL